MPRSLAGTKMRFAESNTVRLPMTMRPPCGRSSPARQRKRRGLAAAGRSEQRDQLAGLDLEADAVDRAHLGAGGHDRTFCRFSMANIVSARRRLRGAAAASAAAPASPESASRRQ